MTPGLGTMPAACALVVRGSSATLRQFTALPSGTGLSAALKSVLNGFVAATTVTPIWNGSVQPAASYGVSSAMSG